MTVSHLHPPTSRTGEAAAARAATASIAPLHIAFLLPPGEFFSPVSGGAIATISMQFARELALRGHRISILTPDNGDEPYTVGERHTIQFRERHQLNVMQKALNKIQMRFNRWDVAYYGWYRDSFIRALKARTPAPDAVVLFNDFISPIYVKAALPKTRVFVDLQNEQHTTRTNLAPLRNCVHRFIACSQHIKTWTAATHGLPEEQLTVLNSGVDLEAFKPRADFLAPRSPVRVLFIGRIDPNKGPDIACDAVAALQREGHCVEMTVAGGLWFYNHGNEMADPYFRDLKTRMDAIHATYLGHVTRPNVPSLVRDHDIVCVLSRSREPFGLVVLEAMASGCAVMASNRGGLPDACGSAGIQLDPDNLNAVTDAMRTLVTSSAALAHEKQRSVARAAAASWTARTGDLEAILST